jgi:hypothetical protein
LQSFVVQNFTNTHVINERTRRSIPTLLLSYKSITLTNIISSLSNTRTSYNQPINLNIYFLVTSTYSKLSGNMSNNITKSLYFLLFNYILSFLDKNQKIMPYKKPFIYKKTIKITILPIYKSKLNLILYYFSIIFSVSNYINVSNHFKVHSNYIVLNSNFNFFMFLNLFYFKVRHY